MQLSSGEVGGTYRVISLRGNPAIKRRLMDMGIIPGTVVKITGRAPLGDPIEISSRGFDLTLRLKEAESIEVEKIE